MVNVLIDPVVIAIPTIYETKETIEKWFLLLIDWLNEIKTSSCQWFYPKEVTYKLFEPEYNALPKLRELQKRHPTIDLEMPVEVINRELDGFFLRENPDSELYLDSLRKKLVVEILSDTTSCKPEEITNRWTANSILDDMLEFLGFLGALKRFDEPFAKELGFATPTLTNTADAWQLEISTEIKHFSEDGSLIENTIAQSFPLMFIPEDLPSFRRKKLVKGAKHKPASDYGKHIQGKNDAERRNSAINGDGQFLATLNDVEITQLEKEALEKGHIDPRDNKGSYFVTYTFSYIIGFASPTGVSTKNIRTEWTSTGTVHSHPV